MNQLMIQGTAMKADISVHHWSLTRIFLMNSALIFSTTVLGIAAGYRLNVTSSLPLGLYRMSPIATPLQRGDLVTFTLPVPLRLHRSLGSFTKPVAGLPGDRVCVCNRRLVVAGMDYGPVLAEAPIHAIPEGHCVTVGEGEVFTASHTPRSYDSRYHGPVRLAGLQRSMPVLTWKEHR
jgi:conjugative transfer signal peptidase TraF